MVLWESWLWQKTGSDAVLIEATGRIVSDWLPVFGNDNVVLESIHTAEIDDLLAWLFYKALARRSPIIPFLIY